MTSDSKVRTLSLMEGVAVCEILKYVIIRWKHEAEGRTKGALLEGELVISMEALRSKQSENWLRCVTTITSAGSSCGDIISKQFVKEMQSMLAGSSIKLVWSSGETGSTQMTFEIPKSRRTLMFSCLVIKQFLHKLSIVHPKIRFHYSLKADGTVSKETIGAGGGAITALPGGLGLLTDWHRYVRSAVGGTELPCSRIHPAPEKPVGLLIPDTVADAGLLGELTLTSAAALSPCHEVNVHQLARISAASVFLYGPCGLPLTGGEKDQEFPFFRDPSFLLDWKKYHLCATPCWDSRWEGDLLLPDASYRVESSQESPSHSQPSDVQEQTLLLFLFLDFCTGFPAQLEEAWRTQALLRTHLRLIFLDNQRVVQGTVQRAVDQTLSQQHQAAKVFQKFQQSLPVAVESIARIVTSSTNGGFRTGCFQALQAADTREFGVRLRKAFHRTVQRRFLNHLPGGPKQLKSHPQMRTFLFIPPSGRWADPWEEQTSQDQGGIQLQLKRQEAQAGATGQGETPSPKRSRPGQGEARMNSRHHRMTSPMLPTAGMAADASRSPVPKGNSWSPVPKGNSRSPVPKGNPTEPGANPAPALDHQGAWGEWEETLWQREVSNLSDCWTAGPDPP
ncbi:type 2 DNA topoisomerase 6 subunit B-like [Tachyglossus aculeatus]|uniref:type 2 DNA topoisomerase 6 subunit B-like n=1 Tax=Tachyglossus aculeatus TaxID=9261 RepID=UPI0018F3C7E0|nr:type 2 DNA topoisomerase 6 subunit B-like [Tachyglossus aculeatus]